MGHAGSGGDRGRIGALGAQSGDGFDLGASDLEYVVELGPTPDAGRDHDPHLFGVFDAAQRNREYGNSTPLLVGVWHSRLHHRDRHADDHAHSPGYDPSGGVWTRPDRRKPDERSWWI